MKFKNEDEILASMVSKAQEYELINTSEDILEQVMSGEITENQYILDLATHAYILEEFTGNLRDVYDSLDITTARGIQLDRLGVLVNVPRHPGLAAQLVITVSLDTPLDREVFIPAGTVVLIDPLQVLDYITYRTDVDVTIPSGVTSTTVSCSSDVESLQPRIPRECVYGLEGFPTLTVTNRDHGTCGRTIEGDDEYRQRLLLWPVRNERGTKQAFDAYLGTVKGLDDYKLIPQPEGVGTLTVVCDCIESEAQSIREGIQENCMLYTDDPVDVVLPSRVPVDVVVDAVITRDPIQWTVAEVIGLIKNEVKVFIEGGLTRSSGNHVGLRIGEELVPSLLMTHLHNMFPELVSVDVDVDDVSVTDYDKLVLGSVEVSIG